MELTIDIKQLKLLNLLAIATKSSRFVSLKNVKTKNEIQNVVINVGCDKNKLKQHDIEFLQKLDVNTIKTGNEDIDKHLETCRLELLKNLTKENNYSKGQNNAYTQIQKNVKVHNETGEILIYAQKISKKTVEVHTPYPQRKKRDKTKAKDLIRTFLKRFNYRQYKFDNLKTVCLEKLEINF